jgi:hypothetical protein
MNGTEALAAWHKSAGERDLLIISHAISRELHLLVSRILSARKRSEACTVILTTSGGDPNGGYRVARALRHYYKHVRLVVPSYCKSAGTLVAIAADELAIGDLGELGPLDIQVRKGSELSERSSGLDIMQALQAVTHYTQDAFHRVMIGTRGFGLSTKLCADFAATVASGIATPLIGQIDPIQLGEMQRATRVALEYGQRLDAHSKNLKAGALERLISDYPAHGFVIDRKEANELFNRVHHMTAEEMALCECVWALVEDQCDVEPIFVEFPAEEPGKNYEDAEGRGDEQHGANEVEPAIEGVEGGGGGVAGEGAAAADGQGVLLREPSFG